MKHQYDPNPIFKNFREYHGYEQKELSLALGFSRGFVSLIENGHCKPSLKFIFAFCNYLGISNSVRNELMKEHVRKNPGCYQQKRYYHLIA